MDKKQPTSYYVEKIVDDIEFIIKQCEDVNLEEFENNELLNNAISFRFIQISESVKMIPESLKESNKNIPWNKIYGLRNKIVHDYGNVSLDVVYMTVIDDLPILLEELSALIKNK